MTKTMIIANAICIACIGVINQVSGLKCFECDSSETGACGEYFKPHLFAEEECGHDNQKCAIQRQLPDKDDWVGIIRGCYTLGQLQGINESNGCHMWENSEGFTALYCFCDKDLCNSAPRMKLTTLSLLILIHVILLFILKAEWS